MTKLTALQLALLTDAAAADDGAIDAANTKTAAALIKRGFLISVPRTDGRSRLLITSPGRKALAADGGAQNEPAVDIPSVDRSGETTAISANAEAVTGTSTLKAEEEPSETAVPKSKPKGKVASLVDLLRQPGGATVEAMMAATGWQAHSVRGAMSGAIKNELSLPVISEKTEAGRVYRLQPEKAA